MVMSESAVGFSVAATRQKAGSTRVAAAFWPGAVNGPASTACASVIVAFGSASFDSDAHDGAAASVVMPVRNTASSSAHRPAVGNLMSAPIFRVYDGHADLGAGGKAGIT